LYFILHRIGYRKAPIPVLYICMHTRDKPKDSTLVAVRLKCVLFCFDHPLICDGKSKHGNVFRFCDDFYECCVYAHSNDSDKCSANIVRFSW
jgi:hypothetical protein